MNILYIIRGLPGSGKSTLAKSICDVNFEADMYFENESGEYLFDHNKLGDAHLWCFLMVEEYMKSETSTICVANTFVNESDIEPYIKLAKSYDYKVVSIVVENRHGNQSIHGVDQTTLKKMNNKFSLKLYNDMLENQNSVCYVGTVTEVKAIEGADNIELVVVGGWNAIAKKGELNVDERVIIATTDAVIPQELSDKMGVTSYLRKGQRVRTVKLRGVYSECLIIPTKFAKQQYLKDGEDKMDELGIFKYEPPAVQIQLASGRKFKYHQNPNFGVYYKFPNLKNVKGMFLEDDIVEITRKIHGTNARYGIVKKTKLSFVDRVKKFFRISGEWIEYEYVYGSHNVEKGSDSQGFYSTDVWRTIAEKFKIEKKLWNYVKDKYTPETLGSGFVLYGEIYGYGIQKNYDYGLKEVEFAGFDLVVNGNYMEPIVANFIITEDIELPYVPVLYTGRWSQEVQDEYTFNNFIEGTKIPHEGIVIKYITGDRHKVAKVINPDYLIYGEKHNVGDSH